MYYTRIYSVRYGSRAVCANVNASDRTAQKIYWRRKRSIEERVRERGREDKVKKNRLQAATIIQLPVTIRLALPARARHRQHRICHKMYRIRSRFNIRSMSTLQRNMHFVCSQLHAHRITYILTCNCWLVFAHMHCRMQTQVVRWLGSGWHRETFE